MKRAVVRVAGADAESFLQGQLSQDVTSGHGLALLLDPTGKVCALLRFQREDDGSFLLDTDEPAGDAVVARLKRFMLRVDAQVELEDGWHMRRAFDSGDALAPGARTVAVWPDAVDPPHEVLVRHPASDDDEWERRRIAAGVPVSGVDIGADTIPAEAGRWVIDQAVSFTKGCYTGQELVARIDSRGGNVPRPLRGIRGDGLVAGADVVLDGKVVGHVTSAVGDIGLGPVGRAVEPGTTVTVDGRPATVEALPIAELATDS